MRAIWIISRLTLREALLDKILYLLVVFAAFLITFSLVIGKMTVGDEMKVIKDLGLAGIHFFGILVTVLIGINLVFRELEKRTVYLILAKPIRRYQFLLGKYLGLALTLLLTLVSLAIVFYLVLVIKKDAEPRFLIAFAMMYLEWLMIAAIAILFSSFSTPLLSTILTFAAFMCGHLTQSLLMLGDRIRSEAVKSVLAFLFYILPNLELFNVRTQVVYKVALSPVLLLQTGAYWFLYTATFILLAIVIFERKDFV